MAMSLHALKEPITMASRSRPGGSPPRMRLSQGSRRTLCGSSKVLAALDAEMKSKTGNEDDSIEILGPFPGALKTEGTSSRARESTKPFRPFFLNGTGPEFGSMSSRKNTPVLHHTLAATAVDSTSAADQAQIKASKAIASESNSDAPTLPVYSYNDYSPKPTTVYTQHEQEANDLVKMLRGPLGFDMEWRVTWRRGAAARKTALVQLSDERMILLIQISSMTKFPQSVKEILESPEILKLGANIHNDGAKLFRDFGIRAQNLVELGALARHVDPSFAAVHKQPMVSLANVVARYAGKSLKKGNERTANWEAVLKENMINYAANDAHCALVVYKEIMALADEHDVALSPAVYTRNVTGSAKTAAASVTGERASSVTTNVYTTNTMGETRSSSTAKLSSEDLSINELPLERPRPQHLRAYNLWHHRCKPLEAICAEITSRGEPLKKSTVISYVVKALQSDRQLPFDMRRLKELVQMEARSWQRHRGWIAGAETEGRGA